MKNELFTPRELPSRETIERYMRGGLPPAEQHEVELNAENDPLLREAIEGLVTPGALAAMTEMRPPNASPFGSWPVRFFIIGAAAIVVGGVVWVLGSRDGSTTPDSLARERPAPASPAQKVRMDSMMQAIRADQASSQALPESVRTTASQHESFIKPKTNGTVDRSDDVQPIASRSVTIEPRDVGKGQQPQQGPKTSHRLIFLHDLKLVHPDELYGTQPPMFYSLGVLANLTSASEVTIDPSAPHPTPPSPLPTITYLDYMDDALSAYKRGEQSMALNDFYFLLNQYPDDVNAKFYAGLCCYDLGMFVRSRALFSEATAHKVDAFTEEAAWYEALSVERKDGRIAARSRYERIARAGGFYAMNSQEKLK